MAAQHHRRFPHARRRTRSDAVPRSRPDRRSPGGAPLWLAVLLKLGGGIGRLFAIVFGRANRPSPPPIPADVYRPGAPGRVAQPPAVPPGLPPAASAPPPLTVPASVVSRPAPMPYRRRPSLLSRGERALWFPLYRAVKGRYRLFCKVRLADIVSGPPGRDKWFRMIRGYHVDFVVCEPTTTEPLLVLELDDRSHQTPRAAERDRFKDEVLAAAGVPIYRIRAQPAYDPIELRDNINRLVDATRHGNRKR